MLAGLLTALHIQHSHPSSHQLKSVTKRYLYALDMDKAIDQVTQACFTCAAFGQVPKVREHQSSCLPPDVVGISFASDVLTHSGQLVLVLRECVTSFTTTTLLMDKHLKTLHDVLIRQCMQLWPLDGSPAIVCTDPATGFKALVDAS